MPAAAATMPTMIHAGMPAAASYAPAEASPPPFDPWGQPLEPELLLPPTPPPVPRLPLAPIPNPGMLPDGEPPVGPNPMGETSAGSVEAAGAPGAVGRGDGAIPAPGKDHLQVGPLRFNLYGGIIAAGGIAGGAVALHAMRQSGVQTKGIGMVLGGAVAAGLVGARLYHVATDWEKYRDNLGDIPKVWEGGLGIYGGLMAGTAAGAILAHRYHLPIAPLLDAAAIGLPIAQAVGRWGNYANQELFGKPTDKPWGLQVDPEHRPAEYRDRNSFHPTFLYESLWNVGLAAGTYALSKTWTSRPPGMLFMTYLGGYAVGRFAVEGLRSDESKEFAGLRTNQWTSLGILGVAGTGAMLLARRGR